MPQERIELSTSSLPTGYQEAAKQIARYPARSDRNFYMLEDAVENPRKWCGLDERSISPSTPSVLNRATHLRKARGLIPPSREVRRAQHKSHQSLSIPRCLFGILMDVHLISRERVEVW